MNGIATFLLTCMLSVSCWYNTVNGNYGSEKAIQSLTAYPQTGRLLSENLHVPPQLILAGFTSEKRDDDLWNQYRLCLTLYEQGNPDDAMTWCEKAARRGHKEAQYMLGSLYLFRENATKDDYKHAEQWLLPAAEQGQITAQANLGTLYFHGLTGRRDMAAAMKWLSAAADQGNPDAQYNLAGIYARGDETPQDFAKAAALLEKAAIQGDADAQHSLSAMYIFGHGMDRDSAQAFFWGEKAAAGGNREAQYNLGMMYFYGSGTEQDYKKAIQWLRRAALRGDVDAQMQLGHMYFYSEGTADVPLGEAILTAYMYYSMAAKQKNEEAIHQKAEIESVVDAATLKEFETAAQAALDQKQ
ncbi:MAG: sel1 repeat family protein [Proteobacteria bacterium]|nr:sel1 repeat family protein [Pseudomonadota bacterium]